MRRLVPLLLVGLVAASASPAPASTGVSTVSPAWKRLFHSDASDDPGSGLALAANGGRVYTVADTGAHTQDVVAWSRGGRRLWVRRLASVGIGAQEIVADPKKDRVYVGGYFQRVHADPPYGLVVTALDGTSGRTLWKGRLRGGWDAEYRLSNAAIAVAPSGRKVFVTGSLDRKVPTGSTIPVGAVVAFRPSDGLRLWHALYRADDYGETRTVAIATARGRVFATSRRVDGTGDSDWLTAGFRASTGRRMWLDRIRGGTNAEGGGIAAPYAAATNPATGVLYVTGFEDFPTVTSFTTVAFDPSTGQHVWMAADDREGIARAIAVSPAGHSVYIAGLRQVRSDWNFGVAAYDATTGARRWLHTYWGNGPNGDFGLAVGVNANGTRVYASGVSADARPLDAIATLAFKAADGTLLWRSLSRGPGGWWEAMVTDLAVSPSSGRVYVESSAARTPGDGDPREEAATMSFRP